MKPLLIVLALIAQSPPSGGTPGAGESGAKPAPVIPIELQAEYFRADGVLAHLRADLAQANTDYEAAVKAIVKACGDGAVPVPTDDKKRLYCAAKK